MEYKPGDIVIVNVSSDYGLIGYDVFNPNDLQMAVEILWKYDKSYAVKIPENVRTCWFVSTIEEKDFGVKAGTKAWYVHEKSIKPHTGKQICLHCLNFDGK